MGSINDEVIKTIREILELSDQKAKRLLTARNEQKKYDEAYSSLKLKEATLVSDGLPGKNQGERDANLALMLAEQQADVDRLKDNYDDARTALDQSETKLKAVKYKARMLEGLMAYNDDL